ncbi:MAG: hypothetical protein MJA83_15515, partial [Gammaproteobacteria bacterium]|nr:hypothetical protein [Gammaproteobacteria bacterium]
FTEFENIGSVVARGFDLNFNYVTEIGPGTLIARGTFTYVDEFEVDKEDGSPKFDGAGSRNFRNNFRTMPQLRGNATATYRWGDNSISGTFRYIDDYENDQSNNATIDSMETFDIQYSRVFSELIGPGDMTLTIGVNNVTDEDPPALVRNFSDGTPRPALAPSAGGLIASGVDRPGYDDYAGHTLVGRVVYGRFTYDF